MDKESKKFKTLRTIGLISLTILVVVGIFLTVLLTEKNSKFEYIDIGQTIELEELNFKVYDVSFENIDDKNIKVIVYIDIVCKKDQTIKTKNYSLDNGSLLNSTFGESIKMTKGENSQYILSYSVNKDKKGYFFNAYHYKYRLGIENI